MVNRVNRNFFIVKTVFFGFRNYSYVFYSDDENSVVIIDPAWEMDVFDNILAERPVSSVRILLTHSHIDHVNLVDKFIAKYDSEIYMSKAESEYYLFNKKNLHFISDGSHIPLGREYVQCILTPGHTVGSVCYLFQKRIFTGDTLFIEGCGMCSAAGGDAGALYDSVQRLKGVLDREVEVYPGHSYGQEVGKTVGFLLENNIYMQIDDKEKFIQFRNRKGQSELFGFK